LNECETFDMMVVEIAHVDVEAVVVVDADADADDGADSSNSP